MAQGSPFSPGPLWQRAQALLTQGTFLLAVGGGVALGVAFIVLLAIPELKGSAVVLLFLGTLLLGLAAVSSLSNLVAALTGRRGRYGLNTVVMILAFSAILILLNFISFRNFARFDTTANQQFSLAQQTRDVLKRLSEEIQATAFYAQSSSDYELRIQQAEDLFSEFQRRSDKFSFTFVNLEAQPSIAKRYDVTREGTIVFENLDTPRTFAIFTPPIDEKDFTTALLVVTGEKQKKVYFLTGQSQHDLLDLDSPEGYGRARSAIVGDNYVVSTLNLRQAGSVPQDAAVLVIAGPKRPLVTDVRRILEQYLREGGRAIFLLNPDVLALGGWSSLLEKWGVGVSEDPIVDIQSSLFGDPRTPIVRRSQYTGLSPITEPLDDTLFPQVAVVQSLIPRDSPDLDNISIVPLALTTRASWTESDPVENAFDPEEDERGPLAMAVMVTALAPRGEEPPSNPGQTSPTTLVVFGDSDFATNQFFSSLNNGDLLVNAINWATRDVELISIRPKPFPFRLLILTLPERDFIRYTSYFLMPVLLTVLGGVVWWRRR